MASVCLRCHPDAGCHGHFWVVVAVDCHQLLGSDDIHEQPCAGDCGIQAWGLRDMEKGESVQLPRVFLCHPSNRFFFFRCLRGSRRTFCVGRPRCLGKVFRRRLPRTSNFQRPLSPHQQLTSGSCSSLKKQCVAPIKSPDMAARSASSGMPSVMNRARHASIASPPNADAHTWIRARRRHKLSRPCLCPLHPLPAAPSRHRHPFGT